jgi:hypothetical protein
MEKGIASPLPRGEGGRRPGEGLKYRIIEVLQRPNRTTLSFRGLNSSLLKSLVFIPRWKGSTAEESQ